MTRWYGYKTGSDGPVATYPDRSAAEQALARGDVDSIGDHLPGEDGRFGTWQSPDDVVMLEPDLPGALTARRKLIGDERGHAPRSDVELGDAISWADANGWDATLIPLIDPATGEPVGYEMQVLSLLPGLRDVHYIEAASLLKLSEHVEGLPADAQTAAVRAIDTAQRDQ